MGYIGAGVTRFNTADELTVTGDAQIDGNTLVVDSTNNRVGVNNASPSTALDITGTVTADGLKLDAANSEAIIGNNASYQGKIKYNDGLGEFEFRNTFDSTLRGYAFYRGSTDKTSLRLDGNGDISFYDDTGTTQGLFWDASTERLGLGTTSPIRALHVESSSNLVGRFESTGSTEGFIQLAGSGTGTAPRIGATANNLVAYTNDAERMRVDSSGNLLVGTTDTTLFTNTSGGETGFSATSAGFVQVARDGNVAASLNRLTSDGEIVQFRKDGSTVGSIGANGGKPYFSNGGNFAIRLDNNALLPANPSGTISDNAEDLGSSSARFQNLYLAGGVYLGGTGSANKLDDYEEGSWTPALEGSTTNPTVTYNWQNGKYVKIGNTVSISCSIGTSAFSGGSGTLRIGGLPFQLPSSSFTRGGSVYIGLQYGNSTAITNAKIAEGNTLINLYTSINTSTSASLSSWGTNGRIWLSATYITNS